MIEIIFGASALGFGIGWLAGRRQSDPRPMRLVSVHEMTAPGLVAKPVTELEEWRLNLTAFAFHANLLGTFAYRPMRQAGVCRRAAWECYCDLLKGAGIVAGAEGSSTSWAGGWSYSKLRVGLKHGRLSLPFPAGSPPAVNSAKLAAQLAQRSAASTGGTLARR